MTLFTGGPTVSGHDAWEVSGTVTLTGSVELSAGTRWGGLLVPSVTIPAGATVSSATLYYKPYNTTHDSPKANWYCQAADSAAAFAATASNITSRARTTAYTLDQGTDIGTGTWRTVNITAPVAEVLGRTGWASGNGLALIGDAIDAAGDLWVRSYDDGGDVWYVEINYTVSSSHSGPLVNAPRLKSKLRGLV